MDEWVDQNTKEKKEKKELEGGEKEPKWMKEWRVKKERTQRWKVCCFSYKKENKENECQRNELKNKQRKGGENKKKMNHLLRQGTREMEPAKKTGLVNLRNPIPRLSLFAPP